MATFKEWYEGQDEFGYRCDRFIDLLNANGDGEPNLDLIEEFLQQAYNQGYFHAEAQRV